jgi:hypothetical protein
MTDVAFPVAGILAQARSRSKLVLPPIAPGAPWSAWLDEQPAGHRRSSALRCPMNPVHPGLADVIVHRQSTSPPGSASGNRDLVIAVLRYEAESIQGLQPGDVDTYHPR